MHVGLSNRLNFSLRCTAATTLRVPALILEIWRWYASPAVLIITTTVPCTFARFKMSQKYQIYGMHQMCFVFQAQNALNLVLWPGICAVLAVLGKLATLFQNFLLLTKMVFLFSYALTSSASRYWRLSRLDFGASIDKWNTDSRRLLWELCNNISFYSVYATASLRVYENDCRPISCVFVICVFVFFLFFSFCLYCKYVVIATVCCGEQRCI